MSDKFSKSTIFPKLVKLYFSKYPTIDFTKIKQTTKKFKNDINRYPNLTVPFWVENRAKDVSVSTINFIKNNKSLLSPSKKSFTYQEYQQLSKFKPAIQNIDILNKEICKINSIKRKKIEGRVFKFAAIFIFSISLYFLKTSLPRDSQLVITIGLVVFLIFCLFNKNSNKKDRKNWT